MVAWLLIQVATATFPVLAIPIWATRLVIALVVLGFPLALIFAWAFELTPEGIKRTDEVGPGDASPALFRPESGIFESLSWNFSNRNKTELSRLISGSH